MANKLIEPKEIAGSSYLDSSIDTDVSKQILRNDLQKAKLDNEDKKSSRGWIGRFWGGGEHASKNIAGLCICFLMAIGAIVTFLVLRCNNEDGIKNIIDFWSIVTPIITLALGYLFGHSQR